MGHIHLTGYEARYTVCITQNTTSTFRFSRLGVGLGLKTSPTKNDVEEWYIPYHGPHEVPKQDYHRRRDSCGDIVEEDTVIFGHQRCTLQGRKQDYGGWLTLAGHHPDMRNSRSRLRATPGVFFGTSSFISFESLLARLFYW
jgi:hypothetical protein